MGHCEDELVAPFPNSVNRSLPRPTTRLKCLCNALGFVLRGVFCQKMYLPPTHPRGHWPSSWPNPGVGLLSTPPPRLLYRFDTMPSSSSSPFRTSLLVYHLRPLSPNVCWHIRIRVNSDENVTEESHLLSAGVLLLWGGGRVQAGPPAHARRPH